MTEPQDLASVQHELLQMIEANESESRLQAFLEYHTEFIPRQFVQHHGISNDLVISQLSFGQDLVSDFVFVSASSDDYWINLIELELPSAQFFRKSHGKGQVQIHSDFRKGLDQIARWRAWLTNPANLNHLYGHELLPIVQSHFHRKVLVKYVLVTGRRAMYEGSAQLQNMVVAQEREDFSIMTWDSLLESPAKHYPLFVGKRRDGFIDILTTELVSDRLFSFIDQRAVRLNRELREAAQTRATSDVFRPRPVNVIQVDSATLALMGNWN